MSDQNIKNIIISDLISDESIAKLEEQYVTSYEDIPSVKLPMSPRRMIGRYLTFLDDTEKKQVSIMVNMLKDQPTINCDCADFSKNGHCIHAARAILSIKNTVIQEHEAKKMMLAKEIALKEHEEKKANDAAEKEVLK